MKRVSFLGAGSWGTALAILCANNGHKVTIWSKVQEEIDILNEHREHIYRLPGVKLPDTIEIESDLEKACTDQDIIVFSVASPYVRSTAKEAKAFIDRRSDRDKIVVEVLPLTNYVRSAEEHQHHLERYPEDCSYCHIPDAILNKYR